MKNIIKFILTKLSRVIYWIIPREFIINNKNLETKLNEELTNETLNHFREVFKKSILYTDTVKIREYAIKTAVLNDKIKDYYYLEFGVWKGKSSNFFSKFVDELFCFDSFEGLEEDWIGSGASVGTFTLNKNVPKLNSNVKVIVGWVEDTLENFLKKHNPKINFVHMDLDTYTPTKFTLEKIKPYLVKNSIIIFDELYNYYGWKDGEFKALKEVFKDNEFEFKAFNLKEEQCVIQIK